jgi:hypothetical protein
MQTCSVCCGYEPPELGDRIYYCVTREQWQALGNTICEKFKQKDSEQLNLFEDVKNK